MFVFRSMNTEVTVTAEDPNEQAIAAQVAAIFWQAERRFSRFRGDSELTKLNRSQGPLVVSPELFDALRRARRYAEMTDGLLRSVTIAPSRPARSIASESPLPHAEGACSI